MLPERAVNATADYAIQRERGRRDTRPGKRKLPHVPYYPVRKALMCRWKMTKSIYQHDQHASIGFHLGGGNLCEAGLL